MGLAPSSAAPANSTRPGPMLWEVSHPKYVGLSAFLIGTQHDVPYSLLGFLLRSVVNHSDVFVGEILPGQPYVGQARRLWGPGPAAPAVQEELHHAAAADSENPETPLQRSAVAVDHSTGPADLNAEEINLLKGLHIIDPAAKEWYSELEEQLTEEEFERVRRAHSSFHFPGVEFGEVQPSALFSGLRLCVACSGFPADGMDHEIHNLAHQRGSWGDCYGIEDTVHQFLLNYIVHLEGGSYWWRGGLSWFRVAEVKGSSSVSWGCVVNKIMFAQALLMSQVVYSDKDDNNVVVSIF